jgi:hypothetical protein
MSKAYRIFVTFGAVATLAVLFLTAIRAQEGAAVATMDKPLDQFTIGNLFPSLTSAGLQTTGTTWQTWGQQIADATAKRLADIEAAIPKIKTASAQAKDAAKTAEKSKDFNAAGAAEGKMRTAEMALKVLDGLQSVTERQEAVGKATVAAGNAMLKLNEADGALEPFRSKGISKPDKAGDPDNRLDAGGVKALKDQAEAIKALAKSLGDAASAMNTLASTRLTFISNLEKAGHTQPPPAN